MSALEYVLGAIGADLVNGLQMLGRRRRIAIEQVEARVEGELNNPLTYLGVHRGNRASRPGESPSSRLSGLI